jgi:hypothetical protein
MPRLTLWNSGRRSNDYKFIDKSISEFFGISGTAVYVHKYIGPYDTREPNEDGTPLAPISLGESSIQDVLFLENRDRKYDKDVYELRGCYNVQDQDFDLRQFGVFLTGDTIFLEFHLNDMLHLMGRRLMAGDVLELPHQRDDSALNDAPAINKFYVVQDASRATDGYSPTWWSHIWRVKCGPMTDAQQYNDILDGPQKDPFGRDKDGNLKDILSTIDTELDLTEQINDEAIDNVKRRNFETRQFWVVPGDETTRQNPWIFAGDGVPPNGAALVGSGRTWPSNPADQAYYLRTDYDPHALFRFSGGVWRQQELDYRGENWSAMARVLKTFINNSNETHMKDGTVFKEKQPLFKAVKLRPDKL